MQQLELPIPSSLDALELPVHRVLVTGWRFWPRDAASRIHEALLWVQASYLLPDRHLVVVDGECPYGGPDLYAHEWATGRPGVSSERHPAKVVGGKLLGPERNADMVALGANVCLGFPRTAQEHLRSGTWSCIRRARKAGIPTYVIPYEET